MIKNVDEAILWVQSRLQFGIKPGLARMEWLMGRLGNPERRLRAVHIGGTNGKGSTLAFLRSILQTADYKVGAFTSPSLQTFTDRITINGEEISDDDFVDLVNIVKPLVEELDELAELGQVTEFEVITTLAFLYFGKIKPVDVVLLEVGLGGRSDSTNIVKPILSIITSVGLDHVNILGSTFVDIAREKSGIIKSGVALISGVKEGSALSEIKKALDGKNSPLYQLNEQIVIGAYSQLDRVEKFTVETPFKSFEGLEISLFGKHQLENASLAVTAALYLRNFYALMIDDEHIVEGLRATRWLGRFEVVSEDPFVVLDGAHNEQAINALADVLGSRYGDRKIKVLFSALHDKDLTVMIEKMDKIADEITFVEFEHDRAATALEMFKLSESPAKSWHPDWRVALFERIDDLDDGEMLLVTGSLYFIGEVRGYLSEVVR